MSLRWAWALLGAALLSRPAEAAIRWDWTPSMTVAAGADSNVLFDNSGGDAVGRAAARIKGVAEESTWWTSADLSVSALGFNDRQRLVFLGQAALSGRVDVSRRTELSYDAKARIADDPLALAQVGLIAGRGRTLGYRTELSVVHEATRDWDVKTTARYDGVNFLEMNDGRDGQAAALIVAPARRLSREWTVRTGLEGRLYLQDRLVGESLAMVPGAAWRIARRFTLDVAAGPLVFFDDQGALAVPVVRGRLFRGWRHAGVEIAVGHDLSVPAGRGGVLTNQLAELVGHWSPRSWEVRARAGYYRSHPSPRDEVWVPGYGLEAGVFREITERLWLGVTALRFHRLESAVEPELVRDAVYLRLDLGAPRP